MNQLNAFLALETIHDNIERAERHRRAHPAPEHPPPGDTLHAGDRRPGARPPSATPRLQRAWATLRRAPATLRH